MSYSDPRSGQFRDKPLICRDCGGTFTFTAGEQAFYQGKGLLNEPRRCPTCRAAHRQERGSSPAPAREMHPVVCAECGTETTVPFVPRLDRPVYCSSCYDRVRAANA